MTLGKSDIDDVRGLLALQPSGDLTPDEARQVDEALRYSPAAKRETERFADCLAILRQAAEAPTGVEDRPSLWQRIEPELGPVRRSARRWQTVQRWMGAVPSSWLVAATLLLASANLLVWVSHRGGNVGNQRGGLPTSPVSVAPQQRLPVLVDPRDERGFVRPLLGLVVCTCEDRDCGVVIDGVLEGTPAAEAGLRRGDLVVAIDDHEIRCPACLVGYLRRLGVGQRVDIAILREGKKQSIDVMLGGLMRFNGRDLIIRESKLPPNVQFVP
jgi:hypothetical protein